MAAPDRQVTSHWNESSPLVWCARLSSLHCVNTQSDQTPDIWTVMVCLQSHLHVNKMPFNVILECPCYFASCPTRNK